MSSPFLDYFLWNTGIIQFSCLLWDWLLLSSIPPCAQIVLPFLYNIFFPTGTDEYHFGESVITLFSGCRYRIDQSALIASWGSSLIYLSSKLQWQRSPVLGTSTQTCCPDSCAIPPAWRVLCVCVAIFQDRVHWGWWLSCSTSRSSGICQLPPDLLQPCFNFFFTVLCLLEETFLLVL